MPQETLPGTLGEQRAASTADGGTALTTTAAFIRLPLVTSHISVVGRNFSTAVVAKFHLNPWLTILKTTDAMVTAPTDYSNAGQNLSAAAAGVVLSSLGTLAQGDFLLVGGHAPFRGVLVDVNATNAGANSTLTVDYIQSVAITACATSDAGTKTIITATTAVADNDTVFITGTTHYNGTWVVEQVVASTSFVIATPFMTNDATGTVQCWKTTSATDGTSAASKTFAQDGNVTWTVPTDWATIKLTEMYNTVTARTPMRVSLYWTRWSVSVVLDSSVTLDRMLAMNRNTANYAELITGQSFEQKIRHGEPGGVGCIEALVDAGTANLVVNAFAQRDSSFV